MKYIFPKETPECSLKAYKNPRCGGIKQNGGGTEI